MPRLISNPTPSPRLRGTESVSTPTGRPNRTTGIRIDSRRALEKAAAGIRLRGTSLKAR